MTQPKENAVPPQDDQETSVPVEETQNEAAAASEEAAQEPSPIEALTAERDELRDLLLRTRAEMENTRKRMNREREEERRYASLPIARDLLPVIDNLQRALEAAEKDRNPDALMQGVSMIARQLEDALSRHGVKAIEALGQPFDPNLHEALQQVPSDEHPPMTIIQEYERGFQLHDRVVRPSKVVVSSAPAENK
jgi:molecular chaperone GrpE